eukprot:7860342-Ditylum_brightwellii.AAC.2
MRYLKRTLNMVLTLSADNILIIKWWVDGTFVVHASIRNHTGATMSLGKGYVHSASLKQKINTRISTETELVAVNDMMLMVLWIYYFLQDQGYEVDKSIIYQDNKSPILLEKNGKASSGKRT